MAKHGNESTDLLLKFRTDKSSGAIVKRFKDEFIVFDLLKIFYDDAIDSNVKTELLIDLEEYGHYSLTSESVDQVVTSLLDIVTLQGDNQSNWNCVCQSLITSTSLLIQLDQLETEICKQLVKTLISIATNINQSDNQRVRSCACHCLIHMEDFQPGLLFAHHDEFSRLARQERTCIYQDYALLAAKVLENIGRMSVTRLNSQSNSDKDKNLSKQMMLQKQLSFDTHDIRQFTAFLLENTGLMTRCGYFRMIESIAKIVKASSDISPMVFKPLMLHQMSTVSCVIFQIIMYLQREFQGQILTEKEQAEFLHRLCVMSDHPCLTLLNKLLVNHWAKFYYLDASTAGHSYRHIIQRLRFKFYPSVFDPVDCQLSKLIMTSLCVNPDDDDGLETSVLLGSLGYIHKLAWHTGRSTVAIVLFKALYYMYQSRNNDSFSSDIQRFLRGLCTDLPHFIPHTIDFLDSIQELNLSSTIYVETLDLLHKQVVMATDEQIEKSYFFYLQILKKAACEKKISQASSLQFLQNLSKRAQYMSDHCWSLGHSILEICRNFLLFQGTDQYYTENPRKDDDAVTQPTIPSWNISFWELVTVVTSLLSLCLLVYVLAKVYQKGLISTNHIFVYLTSTLIGCFIYSIVIVTEVVWSVFKEYTAFQSWQLCFYIEVVNLTVSDWIGVCLAMAFMNTLYCVYGIRDEAETDEDSLKIFVHISNVLSVVSLCIINSTPEHVYNDFPSTVKSCSKQEVFISHIGLAAELDLIVKMIVIAALMIGMVSVIALIKYKLMAKIVEELKNGQRELDRKRLDVLFNQADIDNINFECQSISSDTSLCDNRPSKMSKLQYDAGQWNSSPDMNSCFFRRKKSKGKKQAEYNEGFTGETDSPRISGVLAERKLAKRSLSLSATQESFIINRSPITRKKASSISEAVLHNEHVLYALENFFTSDPALLQPDIKTQRKTVKQSETLLEQETGFSIHLEDHLEDPQTSRRNSSKKHRRRVSWKDIVQKSEEEASQAITTKVQDEDNIACMSTNDQLALVEHQVTNQDSGDRRSPDVAGIMSNTCDQYPDESETQVNLKDRKESVIAVEVHVHHESNSELGEIVIDDNSDGLNNDPFDQDGSCSKAKESRMSIRTEMSKVGGPDGLDIKNAAAEHGLNIPVDQNKCTDVVIEVTEADPTIANTADMAKGVEQTETKDKEPDQSGPKLFERFDQSESPHKKTDQSVPMPKEGSQSQNMPERMNQPDRANDRAYPEPDRLKTEEEMKIESAGIEGEQGPVDDAELTEILTYKETLKMIGQMSHSIMWLSLIYIIFALLSVGYAMLVVSEGYHTASKDKFDFLVDISKGGRVTFIIVYTSVFSWRFGLFRKHVRK